MNNTMDRPVVPEDEFLGICADSHQRRIHYQRMVQGYYERVTTAYRQFWGDSYHFALFQGGESREAAIAATERRIAQDGGFAPGMKVLDLGCGIGGPALNIAQISGAEVTGVDLLAEHVRIANERAYRAGLGSQVSFVLGDALRLPFATASFDHVYSFEAGCHTPDKERLCRECARVLKPGGRFLGLDWMHADNLAAEQTAELIEPICQHCALPALVSPSEFGRSLEMAGFQVLVAKDASAEAGILRNWEPLAPAAFAAMRETCERTGSNGIELISCGGWTLLRAAVEGAFVIGYWHAVKV
jgi:ubiquinone/menaquinone biosynthesis C-methylase UbiE